MEMYKAIFERIEKYEVVKTTAKQIVYKNTGGREFRDRKETTYYTWHETFEQAKQAIIDKLQNKIERTERNLKADKDKLNDVRGLHEA